MRIGMLLDNTFWGDVRVKNEVTALENAGHEVFILCLNFNDKDRVKKFHNSTVIMINISHFFKDKVKFISNSIFDFYSLFWTYHTIRFIKDYNLEAIHGHDLYMARAIMFANKIYKFWSIIDLHENYPAAVVSYSWAQTFLGKLFVKKGRWLKREKKYLSNISQIIVLSENFRNKLITRYPKLSIDKFIIFPNYPDVDELLSYKIYKNILKANNDFIIFYFGGVALRRGVFTLIDSLKIMINITKKIKLLIIGPIDKADKNKFFKEISNPLIKKNIIYFEWKDISLFPSYLEASDVCVSPLIKNAQHESGIANKVFQYMLFGKPVIVSNCKPQEEVITNENAGLVFESGNAEDLSHKILTLHKNSELCKKLGENGRRAVLEKYNLKHASKRLVKYYGNLNGS